MLLKLGVSISDLKPPIRQKLSEIDNVFINRTGFKYGAIITSTNGGVHATGSLHYADLAIDLSGYGISTNMLRLILEDLCGIKGIRSTIGVLPKTLYDVIFHDGHFHIEYDPK